MPALQYPRLWLALRLGLLGLWLAGTAALVWLMLVFPNRVQPVPYRDQVLAAEPQRTLPQLAARLVEAGVLGEPRAFVWYMRLLGADAHLRTGSVVINRALPIRDLVPRLAIGFGTSRVRMPIPEGFTSFDIASRLERYGVCSRSAFEHAARDRTLLEALRIAGDSVEGYLFPATYELWQDTPAEQVLREMVRVFHERTQAAFKAYEQAHDGLALSFTTHQLVTLASIVEREAKLPEERATIAGVFTNRLSSPDFVPHRLQADPTVAYGCLVARERVPSCAEFNGKRITKAMVRDPENPYSTYRIEGLPPGPICNPGLSSLRAAMQPEQHQFFYFVTHGGGRHQFTRTLEEHNARVRGEP